MWDILRSVQPVILDNTGLFMLFNTKLLRGSYVVACACAHPQFTYDLCSGSVRLTELRYNVALQKQGNYYLLDDRHSL